MTICGKLSVMNNAHFEIIEGKKPILLSAPHAYLHKRPRLNMGYRQGEDLTDRIVKEICEKTGAWGIYLKEGVDYDPNFHSLKSNPYKKAVAKIVKEQKIEQFVDIHGLARENNMYDFGIYYATRFTKSKKFAEDVKEGLAKNELYGVNILIFRFVDDYQETLGEFLVQEYRVPSIQIEIAKYIREEKSLRDAFVENFSDIVNKRFV